MNPFLLVDSYKTFHQSMYPAGMSLLYSNLTARKSRLKGVDAIIFFGLQNFVRDYLIERFNTFFFSKPWAELDAEYTRHVPVNTDHIKKLHELGYLPLLIKAVLEGTRVPIGVPCLTIRNTHPDFGWLTNYFETLLSTSIWQAITSATLADQMRQILNRWALKTSGTTEGVQWQGHDFSMRGMSSVESAVLSGMGHLTSFTGTDTIPAIYQLEKNYGATGLIGASVPATEHSVMCMGTKDDEVGTFRRLLEKFPTGILSVVSDTWDLWKVLTEYLPELKSEILARDGKLVIRPDSGDPVDIICGLPFEEIQDDGDIQSISIYDGIKAVKFEGEYYKFQYEETPDFIFKSKGGKYEEPEVKGVIELLWEVFGGTVNERGYKVLDSHIGAIYGDSINLERAEQICQRLADKGFASSNIILGVGSFTYQFNTRDTFGFAVKATYGELEHSEIEDGIVKTSVEAREIFKDPITDDGTKKSKKGLLRVERPFLKEDQNKGLQVYDQQTWEQENQGLLEPVFEDSKLVRTQTLDDIRQRIQG